MRGDDPGDEDSDDEGTAASPVDAGPVLARVERLGREQERLFAELLAGERRFRRLARSVWAVQEEERRRLARELHDGLGQSLTAIKQQLDVALAARGLDGEARRRVAAAAELVAGALADTRELSRLLRPQILDDLGLEPALAWLCRTAGEGAGLAVELRAAGAAERLPAEVETLAFRAVQEALHNAARHSGGRRVTVEATVDRDRLRLAVADDGRGFDVAAALAPDAGSGLRGLRDRLELFGGCLRVLSSPAGTRLEAEVPLAP